VVDRSQAGLTRREFLVGGGVAAGAAVGGALVALRMSPSEVVARVQAALEPGGRVPPSSGSRIVYATLSSEVLRRDVGYAVAVPTGSDLGQPLPLTVCLPGRGGDARSVFSSGLYFADFVAEGIRERHLPAFAVAAVDGGESYWHRRASGEDRMTMLLHELLPLLRRKYGLGAGGQKTAIAGWSMGGYGALLAAERRPDLFCAVCAASPAIWTSYAAMMRGPRDAFDSAADFAANDVFAGIGRLAHTAVRVDCGTADPFYPYVREFVAALPGHVTGGFTTGAHNAGYWRRVAPGQVDFLARALAG